MDIIKEPAQEWGGKWIETKLIAFESYVNAYLNIICIKNIIRFIILFLHQTTQRL